MQANQTQAIAVLGDRLTDLGLTLVTDHRDAEGEMCWRFASLSWNLAIAALLTLAADQRTEQEAALFPPDRGCPMPPPGWYCSRVPGHPGPCAAYWRGDLVPAGCL